MKGGNHGGKNRPYGWRKVRIHLSKRNADNIRREIPHILAGVRPITLAREWNERRIPSVTGSPWQAARIKNIFTEPRIAGYVMYRGEILYGPDGKPVRGQWEPILTEDEYDAVVAQWKPDRPVPSRLGAIGKGHGTAYLLSPFVRCGKCNARMHMHGDARIGKGNWSSSTGARQKGKEAAVASVGTLLPSRSTSRRW